MGSLERHIVKCPHCGKDALDHMPACPSCGGPLTPKTAGGWPAEKIIRTRRVLNIAGIIIAAALLLWRFLR
ncbi:MAG TPA: hypothetical protein VLA21_03700 [Candidatus Limnocylindria bacterium]|nr:hypothetical protein [Candidatus Limnocylindria bacterium]